MFMLIGNIQLFQAFESYFTISKKKKSRVFIMCAIRPLYDHKDKGNINTPHIIIGTIFNNPKKKRSQKITKVQIFY